MRSFYTLLVKARHRKGAGNGVRWRHHSVSARRWRDCGSASGPSAAADRVLRARDGGMAGEADDRYIVSGRRAAHVWLVGAFTRVPPVGGAGTGAGCLGHGAHTERAGGGRRRLWLQG